MIFIYINDCRLNIEKCKLSSKDKDLYNIEFVNVLINNWSQIYMITTKLLKFDNNYLYITEMNYRNK